MNAISHSKLIFRQNMAVHVHVSAAKCNENKVKLHYMPCLIKRSGPANVSKYFEPNITTNEDGVLLASFRGYPLMGKEVEVPKNYTGVILKESQIRLSEEFDKKFYGTTSFDKFTYWNYDQTPSANDQIMSIMDWIDVSSALHSPVDS